MHRASRRIAVRFELCRRGAVRRRRTGSEGEDARRQPQYGERVGGIRSEGAVCRIEDLSLMWLMAKKVERRDERRERRCW